MLFEALRTLFESVAYCLDGFNPEDTVWLLKLIEFIYERVDSTRKQKNGRHFDMSGRPTGKHFKV